jgi:dTDP-4-amino-4,6-dideoxygalactose transaminase
MIKLAEPFICEEEINAVVDVLKSRNVCQGEKVKEFEERFAEHAGVKHAMAVSNGTAALYCALVAAGVKQGDEVITTPFTFIATANSVLMANAKPVFVDVDERMFNVNAGLIEEAVTDKTKAIMPVHLFGQSCEMDVINEIAERHGLVVIEDACQAHGAEFNGKRVGSFGKIGCFSFYATKNITTGEGGMVTTDSDEIMVKVKEFREHGSLVRDSYDKLGYNFRMTDINAAIGIEQLKRLDGFNEKRIGNAAYLSEGLKDVKGLVLPVIGDGRRHIFNQYTLRVGSEFGLPRDELMKVLRENEIGYNVYYPVPLHKQKLYNKGCSLPVAEKAAEEVLSIPVHPGLSKPDLDKVVEVIRQHEA